VAIYLIKVRGAEDLSRSFSLSSQLGPAPLVTKILQLSCLDEDFHLLLSKRCRGVRRSPEGLGRGRNPEGVGLGRSRAGGQGLGRSHLLVVGEP